MPAPLTCEEVITHLRELLHDDMLLATPANSSSIDLKDEATTITLRGIPTNYLIVKMDAFPSLNHTSPKKVFKGDRGEAKRADYVLIDGDNNKLVFIEIKAKKETKPREHVAQQLLGAWCVMDYFLTTKYYFCQNKDYFSANTLQHKPLPDSLLSHCRFVVLYEETGKRKTGKFDNSKGEHPFAFAVYKGRSHPYKQIANVR